MEWLDRLVRWLDQLKTPYREMRFEGELVRHYYYGGKVLEVVLRG